MSELAKNILKVASKAVRAAQKESLNNGAANVYSNGQIYFQLPNGTITQEIPEEYNVENLSILRQ
ncbi:hypothetical protein BBG19_0351 [Francisella sp. MA067296]|uniref:hypothetical protein n=1 Tax=Francisella TaxID=262 RepID=UPI0008FC7467|nr:MULTISPECIES: hypothetical protein [Francisella]APC91089.1 hypothetical protein BBG19_0351 [Francisella sp. MA067296]